MAYPTLSVIKNELGIADSYTDDDVKLGIILSSAAAYADRYCGRSFNASNETRYYSEGDIRVGNTLFLPDEFLQLEQLEVNDDIFVYIDDPDKYALLSGDGQPPYTDIVLGISLPRARNGAIGVRAQYGFTLIANIPFPVFRAIVLMATGDYRASLSALQGIELDRRRATVAESPYMRQVHQLLDPYRKYR